MATRYTPRSGSEIESDNRLASAEVRKWLRDQDEFLFRPDQKVDPTKARSKVTNIHEVEAQQYWDAFRKSRTSWQSDKTRDELLREYSRRTTYYALASAAIVRARFVLTGVAMNHDFDTCEKASWAVIDGYANKLSSRQEVLPQRRILTRARISEYVEEYRGAGAYAKIDQTLIAMAGCAISAVADQIGADQGTPDMPIVNALSLSFAGGNIWPGRRPSGT